MKPQERPAHPITYGSVCSGIEAPSSAWHPLGWKPLWFSEIEPFPKAVLAHHYPDVPDLGDMTALPGRILAGEVPAPDVFVGGTPCQSFSVAGLRRGLADPRGQLTRTFVEILDALDTVRTTAGKSPAVALWENVPGVLSDKDNAFGNFLAALVGEDDALLPPGGRWSNCGCVLGPTRVAAWRVLDAQYFGVAQRRRRVFVVVSARSSGVDPVEVLLVEQGVRRDTPPSREAWQGAPAAAARGAEGGGGGRGTGSDGGRGGGRGGGVAHVAVMPTMVSGGSTEGSHNQLSGQLREQYIVPHVVAPPLTATNDPSRSPQSAEVTAQVSAVLHATHSSSIGIDTYNGTITGNVAATLSTGSATTTGSGPSVLQPRATYPEVAEVCGTLSDGAHHGGGLNGQDAHTGRIFPVVAHAVHENQRAEVILSPAVHFDVYNHKMTGDVAGIVREQHGTNMNAVLQPSMSVRRLTPVECERLQGFPDNHTLIPWKGKPPEQCPDGPRYRALGNSMAVPVIRWIGVKLAERIALASSTAAH